MPAGPLLPLRRETGVPRRRLLPARRSFLANRLRARVFQRHGGTSKMHGLPARRDMSGLRKDPAGHLPAGLCLLQRTSRRAEHALPARPLLPERHGDGGPPTKRYDAAALPVYTGHVLFGGRRRQARQEGRLRVRAAVLPRLLLRECFRRPEGLRRVSCWFLLSGGHRVAHSYT